MDATFTVWLKERKFRLTREQFEIISPGSMGQPVPRGTGMKEEEAFDQCVAWGLEPEKGQPLDVVDNKRKKKEEK